MEAPNPDLRAAAQDYAALGWPVFPCRPGGKEPLTRHGLKDASTDPAQIAAWWEQWPAANVAIATGAVYVLDADGEPGAQSLARLQAEHGPLPGMPAVKTGKGTHYYLAARNGARNTAGKLAPGIDTRGAGGYVIAPPSVHPSGARYAWLVRPDEAALAEAPDWLVPAAPERLPEPAAPAAPTTDPTRHDRIMRHALQDALRAGTIGTGDDCGYGLACQARDNGVPASIGMPALREYAARVQQDPARPFTEQDAERWWRSAHNTPAREPWPERPAASNGRPAATTRSKPEAPEPEHYHLTDLGNAKRLVARHGQDLRHDHTRGLWLVWSGVRWEPDARAEVDRRAKKTVAAIYAEAAQAGSEDDRKAIAKHAARSEARAAIANMVALAASEPGVPVVPAELDADPWLLNCLNGTLDLRACELGPHRREDMITKLAPVVYEPNARHPLWDDLLARVTRGRPEVLHYLHKAAGATLVGANEDDRLFLLVSAGGGGKSTLLEGMAGAVGDYAVRMAAETFLTARRSAGGHSEDLACLAGARMVVASEPSRNGRFAMALLKLLTGGDAIRASRKYERSFEFRPQFTPWIAANFAPAADDDDSGAWRRIRKIPWQPIPKEDRDPKARAILTDPAQAGPAILAWMVSGCKLWQAEGLGDPPAIVQETEAYRQANDPLAQFLGECCTFGAFAWVAAGELRTAYESWCRESGAKPITGRDWGERLRAAGCEPGYRRPHGKIWAGIDLRSDDDCNRATAATADSVQLSTIPPRVREFVHNGGCSGCTVAGDSDDGAFCSDVEDSE